MTTNNSKEIPLFCVVTTDTISKLPIFINFLGSNDIQYPSVDLKEDMLVSGLMRSDKTIETWSLPINLGGLYWRSSLDKDPGYRSKGYVIVTRINQDFALRRVIMSEVVRHYVITVAISAIEKKFDNLVNAKKYGQFVGHALDLDVSGYKVLDGKNLSPKSDNLVNNKVTPVEVDGGSFAENFTNHCDLSEPIYNLYYRPSSKILTCVMSCDSLPTTIAFNEDNIVVKTDDDILIDIFLPFFINLSIPMKYKFDDRSCTLKIVFKISETFKNENVHDDKNIKISQLNDN